MKPNFLVVGTQKGGTTSMYEILNRHLQIYLPDVKELHFFDQDVNYRKGFQWYLNEYFTKVKDEIAIGEITPNYMFVENVPERIFNTLGRDMKFIFIFRNPVDRAFSHYQMCLYRKTETSTFADAIKLNIDYIDTGNIMNADKHYIDRGFYDEQLERYLKYFPKSNMLFLLFEDDLVRDRKNTFKRIYDFLDVEWVNISLNVKNLAAGKSRSGVVDEVLNTSHSLNRFAKTIIPNKNLRTNIKYLLNQLNRKKQADKQKQETLREELINNIYKPHILNLEGLIDRDLNDWLK
ncbi:MAG: sulfotransferase [Bacteroidales bacterium]|nr:sulfotransferase [Bacteroidales bacterium]